MGTQRKEGSCYKQITSRQSAAKDIEDDEDGMGTKDKSATDKSCPSPPTHAPRKRAVTQEPT